ncbi:hypothetical protein HUG17_6450 [Dermatophagoides farinae]|uniref:Uncharacterized protein n=1 Tax=Dermatophagoides farinae TaxID=6954 RepID=A0A9D4P4V8_DERFA|nr:hypothetical protein HUG17_6450 [Dermatophagoides farinae]
MMIRYALPSIIWSIILSILVNMDLSVATVQIQLESLRPTSSSSSSSSSSLQSSSASSSTSNALATATTTNTIVDHSSDLFDPSILYGGGQSILRQHHHTQTPTTVPGSSPSTSDFVFQLLPQTENDVSHSYPRSTGVHQEELYEENSIMPHRAPLYPTAVSAKRSYEVKPMIVENHPVEPSVVNVDGSEQPVKVIFHTQSSPMMVRQIHTPRKPLEVERKNTIDEPHRVIHAVMRPVIQEVREIIQPYRRLTQEIRPVLEEVHTIVSKDDVETNNREL